MFGLFRRSPVISKGFVRRAILRLEGLGDRVHPSSFDPITGALLSDSGGGTVRIATPADQARVQTSVAGNAAPRIENFTAREMGNGLFLFTGRVVGGSPNGLTVNLGGSTSAAGQSTTCLSDGTFSMTVRLRVDGTDVGYVTATTKDPQGVVSDKAQAWVDPTP